MAKDKIIGFLLVLLSLLAIIAYTLLLPVQYLDTHGVPFLGIFQTNGQYFITWEVALMLPVYFGFLMMALIALWIGWTMATTPPPEPLDLDSLQFETDDEKKTETKDVKTAEKKSK